MRFSYHCLDTNNKQGKQSHISMSRKVEYNFKILLLGDAAVGKTSLVQRFVHGKFQQEYLLTIGMEPYSKYETVESHELCYTLFDIAGSQQFTRLRSMFYKGAKGSLVVFDLTRRETFNDIGKWISDAKKGSPDQKFILVGNKNDLDDDREISEKEAKKKAKDLGCIQYIETSAKTGENVAGAFNKLGEELLQKEMN